MTPRDIVQRGVEILRRSGANILGIVANNMSEVLPYYYDRKYYARRADATDVVLKSRPAQPRATISSTLESIATHGEDQPHVLGICGPSAGQYFCSITPGEQRHDASW